MKKTILSLLIIFSIGAQAQTTTTIVGSGTINKVPKFTRVNRIGNSNIFDNGKVGINTNTPTTMLQVNGTGKFTDTLTITTMGQNDNSTRAATTAFVQNLLSQIPLTNYDSSWGAEGNTGTTPFKNFLGTKDAQDLVFRTDNNERMRITATGDIGIGTTQPFTKLDVEGSLRINDGTQAPGRVFTSNSNGTGSWQVPSGGSWDVAGNNIFNNNTGNVGIGINSPQSKLSVSGNIVSTNNIRATGLNDGTATGAGTTIDYRNDLDYGRVQTYNNTTATFKPLLLSASEVVIGGDPQNSGYLFNVLSTNAAKFYSTGGLNVNYECAANNSAQQTYTENGVNRWLLGYNGENTSFRIYNQTIGEASMIIPNSTNNILVGGSSENDQASSKFTITSTNKGFLPPRMTTGQRNAIESPAKGLVIYNLTTEEVNFHNGTKWMPTSKVLANGEIAIGSNGTNKKAITIIHNKNITGTQNIQLTVKGGVGEPAQDVFFATVIGNSISNNHFSAVVFRADGTDWGQNPILMYCISNP